MPLEIKGNSFIRIFLTTYSLHISKIDEYKTEIKLNVQPFEVYYDRLMLHDIMNNFKKNEYIVINKLKYRDEAPNYRGKYHYKSKYDVELADISLNRSHSKHIIQELNKESSEKMSKQIDSIKIIFSGIDFYIPDTLNFDEGSTKGKVIANKI